jgi:excinuclease ABC subunit C
MVQVIVEKLQGVSTGPGVYLMKNSDGVVIYVGKALNLKKRLSSYFKGTEESLAQKTDLKTGVLIKKIDSFDTIVTGTEKEALILESNLIKKHKPRYNVILKDDKRYPSLRLDIKSRYPNLSIIRKAKNDNALYFGPYASSHAVRQTLRLIHKTFRLRKCTTSVFRKRTRPCLNYQMGTCLGPCCNEIERSAYGEIVKEVTLFLKGKTPVLMKEIKDKMTNASLSRDYELAAVYRDKLFALQKTLEKQIIVSTDSGDRDVFALACENGFLVITLLVIRGGSLQGTQHFSFNNTISNNSEILGGFIRQYYETADFIPDEVLVPFEIDDTALTEDWLSGIKGERIRIHEPKKGDRFNLLKMAAQNAENEIKNLISSAETFTDLLARLQKRLKMAKIPERIECFDNSNISGSNPVSGMVVFEKGKPAKQLYRSYKIRVKGDQNDYAYMDEVLRRRFGKGDASKPYPDLILIDGGKGHLNIAHAVLRELEIDEQIQLIGIAKKDEKRGEPEDRIYKHGRSNPVNFEREGDLHLFLQRIRDEAHRFAISFHRKQRLKKAFHSALDEIPGIGKRKKEMLVKHFGSIKKIRAATPEELSALPGITAKDALNVKRTLR